MTHHPDRCSSCRPLRRETPIAPGFLLALPLTLGFLPSAATAGLVAENTEGSIYWEIDSNTSCSGGYSISCGPGRIFGFYDSQPMNRIPSCAPSLLDGGSFVPEPYDSQAIPNSGDVPCDGGSCYSADGDRFGPPDVLVIDWDDPHGWSVGGVIDRISGGSAQLRLSAFGASHLDAVLGNAVTDAHVLEKLCEVLETEAADRPEVVNMSFGRPTPAFFPSECKDPGDQPFLCHVNDVLADLEAMGVHLVAAAGHHGRELFPASGSGTWSAGAVDLLALEQNDLRPALHTPETADLLMPGYGVFVGQALGNPGTWSAPPGSSYSAAVATGWITRGLRSDPGADAFLWLSASTDYTLGPVEVGEDQWALGFDPSLYMPGSLSSTSNVMVETAIGHRPNECLNHGGPDRRALTLDGSKITLPGTTLDDLRETLTVPCPESFPCVPCHDMPDEPPLAHLETPRIGEMPTTDLARTKSRAQGPAFESAFTETVRLAEELKIDLSQSTGFDESKYRLLGLYFRTDGQDFRFSDSTEPNLLDELERGLVDSLTITNPPIDAWDRSTHLVFHLLRKATTTTSSHELVQTVPITVHGH